MQVYFTQLFSELQPTYYEGRIQGNNLGKAPFVQHVTKTFDRLFYTAVLFG